MEQQFIKELARHVAATEFATRSGLVKRGIAAARARKKKTLVTK